MQPHGLLPARLLCPWDFPGKHTGVGCHFLLQGIFPTQGSNLPALAGGFFTAELPGKPNDEVAVLRSVANLRLTLCNPMDCCPPGSSVHGISQARMLKWVATSSSRGSSRPRNGTLVSYVSCTGRWVLYHQHHVRSPRGGTWKMPHQGRREKKAAQRRTPSPQQTL